MGAVRRLRACVQNWPDAETDAYHPSCCRFPKACSATVYDPQRVREEDLEDVGGELASDRLAQPLDVELVDDRAAARGLGCPVGLVGLWRGMGTTFWRSGDVLLVCHGEVVVGRQRLTGDGGPAGDYEVVVNTR